ncbi:MAG: hypothetical protein WA792_10645 [Pseudolabrys sp.]
MSILIDRSARNKEHSILDTEAAHSEHETSAARGGRTPRRSHDRLVGMPDDRTAPESHAHRVLDFRQSGSRRAGPPKPPASSPVAGLGKYEGGEQEDDYRARMIVNVVALLFILGLIGAGLWIADTMADMRKNQDCVLSGRRGCTPVEVQHDRW